MQRRELDRHTVLQLDRLVASHLADGLDGIEIALVIALGVGRRPCALAQHVKGTERALAFPGALDRFGNLATEDELLAHDAHGAHRRRPDHRLTHFLGHLAPVIARILPRLGVHINDIAGQHQAQRRGVHQPVFRTAHMFGPGAAGNFFRDQPVRCRGIGDTQQGLGQTHQRQPLAIGQAELLQEAVHQAARAGR